MKIAVNTRLLLKDRLEGIGTFMDEVLKRIVHSNPEIEFHFIFDRKYHEDFIYGPNVVPHVLFPPTRHVALFDFWFNYLVPKKLKKIGADAFLSLDGITSTKLSLPNHLVIHDINFEHRPQDLPKTVRKYYQKRGQQFAHSASQLSTVSNYSKNDIAGTYGLPLQKIDVVYNAAKDVFAKTNQGIEESLHSFGIKEPYFIYVGSLHPRKNLLGLLQAFFAFKKEHDRAHQLVVVGNVMWDRGDLQKLLKNNPYSKDVIFTGRVNDQPLVQLLSKAQALTYVPFFEGFGIPIVEAFQVGVPVITSNCTSLPEVAGGAALLCDPFSSSSIKKAMEQIQDDSTRKKMINNGIQRSKDFNWDNTATQYWESVQKIWS